MALVYGLNRLDSKKQQRIKRAGTLTRFPNGAMSAHVTVEAVNVGVDRSTSGRMGDLNNLGQVEFDSAALAMGTAGWGAGRTVDAATAHVLSNLCHVLVEFCLCVHCTPSFLLVGNCRIDRHWYHISKSNAGLISSTVRRIRVLDKSRSVHSGAHVCAG